ncbi:MAG: VanW family protein [Chloroflexota bacterium]|nr:VanW family protein [Chloroflexota bacterium]
MATTHHTPGASAPDRSKLSLLLRTLLLVLVAGVWLVAIAMVGGIIGSRLMYENSIYPGASVRGIDLSGLSLQESIDRLQIEFDPYPLAPVTVAHGDQSWTLTAEDLGVDFDAYSAARAAYDVGRQPIPVGDIMTQVSQIQTNLQDTLSAYQSGHEVLALETVDKSAGLDWLRERAYEIDSPAIEAALRMDGTEIMSTESQTGYSLDIDASHRAIYEALLANQGERVELIINERKPLLSDVSQAEVFVRQVLNGPITLTASDSDLDTQSPAPAYTIPVGDLASLLTLDIVPQLDGSKELMASLDVQPLREQVQLWALELAREPREARLDFDPSNGEISVVTPSQIGRMLDIDASMEAIRSAALSSSREAELPLRLVEPSINMHKIDEMGVVELVAKGTTDFAGSSADRIHNIKTAAAAVDNTVVPPGEVFSFNAAIGDVDAEHGYKDSLIIWGDRTAVGIGGGVCQVSTTAFRAAFYGGFPIEERWNHGYVVGWYGKPGLDATIYTPDVDFKFRNTTDNFLIIKSEVNDVKGKLTFNFYGTKPDWNVQVVGPEVIAEKRAGTPVYQEDANLTIGQVQQVEWAKKGVDVQWNRLVKGANGEIISDETLESSYTPWPAYYLVGPGTAVPSGVDFRPLRDSQSGG